MSVQGRSNYLPSFTLETGPFTIVTTGKTLVLGFLNFNSVSGSSDVNPRGYLERLRKWFCK